MYNLCVTNELSLALDMYSANEISMKKEYIEVSCFVVVLTIAPRPSWRKSYAEVLETLGHGDLR